MQKTPTFRPLNSRLLFQIGKKLAIEVFFHVHNRWFQLYVANWPARPCATKIVTLKGIL